MLLVEEEIPQIETNHPFWRGLTLTVIFLVLTPIAILASLVTLFVVSSEGQETKVLGVEVRQELATTTGVQIYASLPGSLPTVDGEAEIEDARTEIIKQYLAKYDSPLLGFEDKIIEEADQQDIDFRLITAIAQQESNLCKRIPAETFNCWGWGIHSEGTLGFESYNQGIEVVSRGIRQAYIDEGLLSPDEIMNKYTPLSNGSWAEGVNTFMAQMQ